VLTASAELRQARGDVRGAAEDYRLILKLDPKRTAALIGFVSCASQYDPAAADALAGTLPEVPGVAGVDAEALELQLLASAPAVAAAPRDPKRGAAPQEAKDETTAEETEEGKDAQQRKRRRHKKKKKSRLPKDLDKAADPERWLPMKQRSYYVAPIKKAVRGKKGRIGGAGGHQGVNVTAEVAASLDAAAKAKVSPPPPKKGGPAPNRRKK
jgi:signal recognition particle subunit SRP72